MIGIDPGATTGWVVFWEAELWSAGIARRKTLLQDLPEVPLLPAVVVVEVPRIYPLGKGKGDPNNLIDLAVHAGLICGWYKGRIPGIDTVTVSPRRWKGTVRKSIHNERTLAALTPAEREKLPRRPRAKDFDHNMLDAVGIAIWQLERERQR